MRLTERLHPVRSIRPLTYRTLFGLLFTTGMRIGEALNLRLADIHSNSLTVRQTKFGKSRWLPLHQSTVDALQFYLTQRHEWVCDNDRVFRHSFATNALRRCSADRDAVEQNMLALSTYLGHVSVSSTYWYLEQTPELLRDIAAACEQTQSGEIS